MKKTGSASVEGEKKSLSQFLISTPPKQAIRNKKEEAKYILGRRIALHLCARSLLPFDIVSSEGFTDFLLECKVVQNRDEVPHRTTISRRALRDVVTETESGVRKVILEAEPIAISLAYDLWTDAHARNPYANITAMFIDKNWRLVRVNLGTNPIDHPHTAVLLEKHFTSKVEEFGLSEFPKIAVKDNGGNVKACARMMSATYGFSETEADDQNCFAHCIHLLLTKDVMQTEDNQEIAELVKAVSKIKRIHHALVYRKADIAKLHLKDESLKLQQYLDALDDVIGE